MSNLDIYDKIKDVPEKAQKKITGGRLNGMTDIKPMWRIEKLTEVFGMVGVGWKTKTLRKEIIEGANSEKIAVVDIELYVKCDDVWSEPIEGTGGSSFVAKEKNGLYTSDECFKMAYTDALSVACKALGMGANIYWGDSKYDTTDKITTKEQAENYVITFGKKHNGETLKEISEKDPGYLTYLMNYEKTEDVIKQAITLLTGEVEDKTPVGEMKISAGQIQTINMLVETGKADYDGLLNYYKIKDLSELTFSQAQEVITKKKGI